MLDLNIATADFTSVSLKDFRDSVTEQINQRRDKIREELVKVKGINEELAIRLKNEL